MPDVVKRFLSTKRGKVLAGVATIIGLFIVIGLTAEPAEEAPGALTRQAVNADSCPTVSEAIYLDALSDELFASSITSLELQALFNQLGVDLSIYYGRSWKRDVEINAREAIATANAILDLQAPSSAAAFESLVMPFAQTTKRMWRSVLDGLDNPNLGSFIGILESIMPDMLYAAELMDEVEKLADNFCDG